jgi:hypothetical protein
MTTDDFLDQLNRPLGPGMPAQSAGLGACWGIGGGVRGVNDRWALLVEGFAPTEYELVVLAKHYLDVRMEVALIYRCYEQYGSDWWRQQAFADARLNTIEQALGEEKFNAAIAKKIAEWTQKFSDIEKEEQSLAPCTKCGARRSLAELANEPADGPAGLCARCMPHERRHLTPCANCGCERDVVGSAYTGDLCWNCASERLAPCTNCGGKRWLGPDNRDLCDACHMATVPPCKYCGAKRYPPPSLQRTITATAVGAPGDHLATNRLIGGLQA